MKGTISHFFLSLINRIFWQSDAGSQLFWSLDQSTYDVIVSGFHLTEARGEAYPIPLYIFNMQKICKNRFDCCYKGGNHI